MTPTARHTLLVILLLGVIAVLSSGCGVVHTGIGNQKVSSWPLASVLVAGTEAVGQQMSAELKYAQTYYVDVSVECDLEQGSKVVQQIGSGVMPANPNGRPHATPTTGTLSFPFRVENAGSYTVVCFTTRDPEDKLATPLSIRPQ